MRNEPWVNRFLFAWNDTLFFDPLDVYYEPRDDHFLAGLDERVRERFVRSGIWWSHRHDLDLPAQGWKIHVSAGLRSVHRAAAAVIGYLTERGSDFKIALDLNVFEMLNSKAMSRGNSGKLVTVYPRDDADFRACLTDLARLLDDAEEAAHPRPGRARARRPEPRPRPVEEGGQDHEALGALEPRSDVRRAAQCS